ncbi:unnamed protein product, partial [Brachionus calyciflorus]
NEKIAVDKWSKKNKLPKKKKFRTYNDPKPSKLTYKDQVSSLSQSVPKSSVELTYFKLDEIDEAFELIKSINKINNGLFQ